MQTVSNNFLQTLQSPNTVAKNQQMVVEFYRSTATPTDAGFDPAGADFLFGAAFVNGISFRGRVYRRMLFGVGDANKVIRKELSKFSVQLSNADLFCTDFERDTGFEGLICVYRLIDRLISVNLEDSAIQFTGKCKQPEEFTKSDLSCKINVTQILDGVEVYLPRRKLTVDDPEGRPPSDPLFEGFLYTQRDGKTEYTTKKKVLFFFHKTEKRLLQYSSHTQANANQYLPLVLGRAQIQFIMFASIDQGKEIQFTALACEGPIRGFENLRSITKGLTFVNFTDGTYTSHETGEIVLPKLGYPGGQNGQINDDLNFISSGVYSRTAYVRGKFTGTEIESDDEGDLAGIILGYCWIPILGADGNITGLNFTDNPILQARWLMSEKYVFDLAKEWFDDKEIYEEAAYCDHILVDHARTDLIRLSASQADFAGTAYKNFASTGLLSAEYLRGDGSAFLKSANYQFYNQVPVTGDDGGGGGGGGTVGGTGTIGGSAGIVTTLRRRSTSNVVLSDQMKAIDFIYDVLLASCNGVLLQKANGKFVPKIRKPEDFAFFVSANQIGDSEIHVKNINPFAKKPGRILIGANLPTSEVRKITGFRYDTAANFTVTASGGVTSSAATLSGGTNTTAPFAVLTVTSAAGAKTIRIDNFELVYYPSATDDVNTCAAFLEGLINSNNELNKYIKAVWNTNATVTVSSRVGYLSLDLPLEFAHLPAIANPTANPSASASSGNLAAGVYQISYSFVTLESETLTSSVLETTVAANSKLDVAAVTLPARVLSVNWYASVEAGGIRRRLIKNNTGAAWSLNELPKLGDKLEPALNETAEELHRIAMAFADKGSRQANLANSNIIKGTFSFPLGGKTSTTNRVKVAYRSAVDDFAPTEYAANDKAHQAKVRKTNTLEVNGAAIDNYHQAFRVANQILAEERDGNVRVTGESDGEALLLEETDPICISDESGRFVNFPCRIEELTFKNSNGFPSVSLVAKKYNRKYSDDQVAERITPLAVITNASINTEQTAPGIWQYSAATNTTVEIGVNGYTEKAKFRKINISPNADMSGAASFTIAAASFADNLLPVVQTITKAGESAAVTKYLQCSHSSNGQTFGAASNVLGVIFAAAAGGGGTAGGGDAGGGGIGGGSTGGGGYGGDPGGSCFAAGTVIGMADGTAKAIELISPGDEVLSFTSKNDVCAGRVLKTFAHTVAETLLIETAGGLQIETTAAHKFRTPQGAFKAVGAIKDGESVMILQSGELVETTIKRREVISRIAEVYNFEVGLTHCYFANDFAVSNNKEIIL